MRRFARGARRYLRNALLLLLVGVLAGACNGTPTEEELQALFDRGEHLCLEQNWLEARATLRQYLLHDPTNAGAHFYLGRAYLFARDFRPAIAEGELQLALTLYVEDGRGESPIERYGKDYFEMTCSLESAKVCIRQIDFLRSLQVPRDATRPIFERGRDYIEAGRAVMPNADDVRVVEGLLQAAQHGPARPLPQSEPGSV